MALELINLCKTFPAQGGGAAVEVLRGIDCRIEAGAFVSLVGPSGCGKTTLLRIVAGLEEADRGEVRLEGRRVDRRTERIGMVFQEYALFPWRTTVENIEMGLEISGVEKRRRRSAALEYVRQFGLEGFEHRYPKELSGGMRQRVAIARTLITGPDVTLMDEPFGSLDSQTRNEMQEFLLDLWQARRETILFVTHNVDEAVFLSDVVLVLSRRPAAVVERFEIGLRRPRDRTGPECNAVRRKVLEVLSTVRES